MSAPVKRNQFVDLDIESLGFGGKGIAHIGEYIVFVDSDVVPGQKVRARVRKAKSSYAEAVTVEHLQKSPFEIEAPCPYFDHCGGCKHQNLPYDLQLKQLQLQVEDLYHHLGGFTSTPIEPILAGKEIFRYRNKMEFAFSNRRWLLENFDSEKPVDFALGLRAPGVYWKAIDIDDCLIAPEETRPVLETIRRFARDNRWLAYDQKTHTGYLRHVVLRKARRTDQVLVNIVTNSREPERLQALSLELSKTVPNVVAVVNTVTQSWSGTTMGETIQLWGEPDIVEKLGELEFAISPASFFQTNTVMAEKLYGVVKELAEIAAGDIVWDLYCGTGSIALYLAEGARAIYGFEIVPEAIRDARKNAARNQVDNVYFFEGNLDKLFREQPELLQKLPRPDLLVIDPPRGGMHPRLVSDVVKIHPGKIVYVSCNPATQVRDLRLMVDEGGYRIDRVQPVDLFPHTPHIEVVTRLSLMES